MYKAGQREPSESFLQIWHGQSTVELEPGTLERTYPVLVVGDTDKRDWAGVIPRNRAPPLCLLVYEDLEILDGRGVEQELLYRLVHKEYFYTVRRGRYFSGFTHYEDNRSENRIFRDRTSTGPSSRSLVDDWIRRLADDQSNDSDSDEEGYNTDDNDDHRDSSLFYIQTHISHFTDTGIVTKDRVGRPIDAVICATGANVDHHCPPFSIIANGLDLKTAWRHDRHFSFPYNYLGVATPGFPNLLWIGGPNAAGHGGSVPNSVENQIVYIAKIVRKF
ncbi:hypothetical protein BDW71DRAFT_205269 [Aspergillus fruticulosus]